MYADLKRDDFLELLDKLGSEDDQEVLSAARELHAQITVAGVDWDSLLVPDAPEVVEADEADEDEAEEEEAEAAAADDDDEAELDDAEKSEARGLIEKLLERSIGKETKDELQEYKQDIADGDFLKMDLRYLRALAKRLGVK